MIIRKELLKIFRGVHERNEISPSNWKSVQYISNLEHTVNVIVDGWGKYGPWSPR